MFGDRPTEVSRQLLASSSPRRRTVAAQGSPLAFRGLIIVSRFTCKSAYSESGAEGIRTPDLRRAKAAQYFSHDFWSLQNSCKQAYFLDFAFPEQSGHSLRLLHSYCPPHMCFRIVYSGSHSHWTARKCRGIKGLLAQEVC